MNLSEEIHQISTHVNCVLRKAASKNNITFSQAQFLLCVPSEGTSISDLSHSIGVDISTMSRNVDKLELLGLVYKNKCSEDRRAIKLLLTDSGAQTADLLFAEIDAFSTKVLTNIPQELQRGSEDLLEQINWACIQSHAAQLL